MLDRGLDVDALSAPPELDGAAIASAFNDSNVDLPLLEVDEFLPSTSDDFIIPLDLESVVPDDLLGEPPTFGESATIEFEPAPLFGETNDAQPDDLSAPVADASSADEEWSGDEVPEVLIDGEWHDERMAGLVSGEMSAIRPPAGDVPPRPRARFDDLSAALMWPPNDDDASEQAGDRDAATADAGDTNAQEQESADSSTYRDRMRSPRRTLSFGGVEEQLRRRLELEPANLTLRRQLGEALLDQGSRMEGLEELDIAMRGFEVAGDLENARGVADIVLRVVPTSVRHHQKRVEYAVRSNDRVRLVEAYVELADSLFRSGEPEKARVVYSRVLELSPGNGRARFALGLLSDEERAVRGATPPISTATTAPAPSPADMVSMFDRSIPRTPDREVTASRPNCRSSPTASSLRRSPQRRSRPIAFLPQSTTRPTSTTCWRSNVTRPTPPNSGRSPPSRTTLRRTVTTASKLSAVDESVLGAEGHAPAADAPGHSNDTQRWTAPEEDAPVAAHEETSARDGSTTLAEGPERAPEHGDLQPSGVAPAAVDAVDAVERTSERG